MKHYVLIKYRWGGYKEDPTIIGIETDPKAAESLALEYVNERGGKYAVAIKLVINGIEVRTHKYFPHHNLVLKPNQFWSGARFKENDDDPVTEILWLDDKRNPSDSHHRMSLEFYEPYKVTWVKTYEEFVAALTSSHWDGISFDNDLGTEKEGSHAFNYLEELIMTNLYTPVADFSMQVHSANGSAAHRIQAGIENLAKYLLHNKEPSD